MNQSKQKTKRASVRLTAEASQALAKLRSLTGRTGAELAELAVALYFADIEAGKVQS